MDIYEDRTDWQMSDHVDYNSQPLEWPENVFGEELGGGQADDDNDNDNAAMPGAEEDDEEAGEDDEAGEDVGDAGAA